MIFPGQVIAGGCISFTVTVNEQVEVLPAASVARHTFVVVPTGNTLPLGRPDTSVTTDALGTLPEANNTMCILGKPSVARFVGLAAPQDAADI